MICDDLHYSYNQGLRLWAEDVRATTADGLATINITCTPTAYELRHHDMDEVLGGTLCIARCAGDDAADDCEDRVQKLADFLCGKVTADNGVDLTVFRT